MDMCKNLKVIGKHGVGCNTRDLTEAKKRRITVLNTPGANDNSVAELIVGLIGTGNIARRAAEILRNGFGVKVIGYDPYVSREVMAKFGYEKYDTVQELITNSDIVNEEDLYTALKAGKLRAAACGRVSTS